VASSASSNAHHTSHVPSVVGVAGMGLDLPNGENLLAALNDPNASKILITSQVRAIGCGWLHGRDQPLRAIRPCSASIVCAASSSWPPLSPLS
jgi:hypothetical protein